MMSHQRRFSSPPASALPVSIASDMTRASSRPSRRGMWSVAPLHLQDLQQGIGVGLAGGAVCARNTGGFGRNVTQGRPPRRETAGLPRECRAMATSCPECRTGLEPHDHSTQGRISILILKRRAYKKVWSGSKPRRTRPTVSKCVWRPWTCWATVCASRKRRSKGLRVEDRGRPRRVVGEVDGRRRLGDRVGRRHPDPDALVEPERARLHDAAPDLLERAEEERPGGADPRFRPGELRLDHRALAERLAEPARRLRLREGDEGVERAPGVAEGDAGEARGVEARRREAVEGPAVAALRGVVPRRRVLARHEEVRGRERVAARRPEADHAPGVEERRARRPGTASSASRRRRPAACAACHRARGSRTGRRATSPGGSRSRR